jgi:hypothetical protein
MSDVTTNKVYMLMRDQYKTNFKGFIKIGAELKLRREELKECKEELDRTRQELRCSISKKPK